MAITIRPAAIAALGVVTALGLGACGSGGGEKKSAATAETPTSASATEPVSTTLALEAHDISLTPKDLQAAAGTIAIRYTNAGAIEHTLLIDGISGFKLDVASAGATDTGTVKLGPGTYTLYCNIPGHRAAGMEAHLTVR